MKYLIWLVGGIAALDQGMKSEIEQETDGEFPRDLPGAKGQIRIHRNHNYGFPFGFLKEKPQLVTAVPLAVSPQPEVRFLSCLLSDFAGC